MMAVEVGAEAEAGAEAEVEVEAEAEAEVAVVRSSIRQYDDIVWSPSNEKVIRTTTRSARPFTGSTSASNRTANCELASTGTCMYTVSRPGAGERRGGALAGEI